jgi:hypothetical protein
MLIIEIICFVPRCNLVDKLEANVSKAYCTIVNKIYIIIDEENSESKYQQCNENGEDDDVLENVHGMW